MSEPRLNREQLKSRATAWRFFYSRGPRGSIAGGGVDLRRLVCCKPTASLWVAANPQSCGRQVPASVTFQYACIMYTRASQRQRQIQWPVGRRWSNRLSKESWGLPVSLYCFVLRVHFSHSAFMKTSRRVDTKRCCSKAPSLAVCYDVTTWQSEKGQRRYCWNTCRCHITTSMIAGGAEARQIWIILFTLLFCHQYCRQCERLVRNHFCGELWLNGAKEVCIVCRGFEIWDTNAIVIPLG